MRKRMNSMLMGIFLLLILPSIFINSSENATSYTVVGESHITSNTTWNASAGPYYIEGNVTVDYGWNLTIEPGVDIYFNGPHSIYVEGELYALGNTTHMITFTTNISSQNWNRIQVNATGYAEIKYCSITNATFGVCLNNSQENVVEYNNISSNFIGVYLDTSANNTISNNIIQYNDDKGLYLLDSKDNIIWNNNISHGDWIGIQLYTGSTRNSIRDNNISNNVWSGLNLYLSFNNTIIDNDIMSNNRGIQTFQSNVNEIGFNRIFYNYIDGVKFQQSHQNVMTNNNISHNGITQNNYGVYITASNFNEIFHNTFMGNSNQSFDDRGTNSWDDGYPYGGNFWSDYSGVDLKRGKNQDVPGSDGIGDTNYTIDTDSVDHYPLINVSRNIAPFLISLDFPQNNSYVNEGMEIRFDILVKNIQKVNYSLNFGSNITIEPYNITASSSFGWIEGNNRIDVFVLDDNGNWNSSWFSFIFDSTKPIIELIAPPNGSVIDTKGIIDISFIEPNIDSATYRLNNGSWESLLFPYDLNCSAWPEGNYWIDIQVNDLAGNDNSTYYVFTVDTTPPFIFLNYPGNNSYIKPGEKIILTISDLHLNTSSIYYTVSHGGPIAFAIPYSIDTSTWDDKEYSIMVYAYDTLGHENYRSYNVTVDSAPPTVVLNSPQNNSVIRAGIPLNFSASDDNPFTFNYFINMGSAKILLPPYNIITTLFDDGIKIINVNLTDSAGNYIASSFVFTIDSSYPEITLQFPQNGSSIRSGIEIEIDVRDSNIEFVNYSLNRGNFSDLLSTMRIETINWDPGTNTVEIFAADKGGNKATASFTFFVDNTPPEIVSSNPSQDEKGVSINSKIEITFNELMDKESFKSSISIDPYINFTLNWSADNLTLIITPIGNLSNGTKYTITINSIATDVAGNPLASDFILSFTTGPSEEFSIWMMFIVVVAIIIVIILFSMFIARRRKMTAEVEEGDEMDEFGDIKKEEGEELSEKEDMDEVSGEGEEQVKEEGVSKEEEKEKGEKESENDQKVDSEGEEEVIEQGTKQVKDLVKQKR